MIKQIALLPLDSRPCNVKFPHYVARISGVPLILPPTEALGNLKDEGRLDEISMWLERAVGETDILILSLDMLVFGGLAHSRRTAIDTDEALSRLRIVSKLKEKDPRLKIHAFSIIMRPSITVYDERSAKLWSEISEYLMAGDKGDHHKLDQLKNEIPKDVLEGYFKTRERNHEVNMSAIKLVDKGLIDLLILGTDDAMSYGPQAKEKSILLRTIEKHGLSDRVKVIDGADEIAAMLVSRIRAEGSGTSPKVSIVYSNSKHKRVISLYEDVSVERTIADHVETAGGIICDDDSGCDIKLFVNTPEKHQEDLFLSSPKGKGKINEEMLLEIKNNRKLSAVADIRYCNGADAELVSQMLERELFMGLSSFSGFNTTSNSVGIALAHSIAYFLSGRDSDALKCHRELLMHSLLSDYLYQSVVRPEIIEYLKSDNRSVIDISGSIEQTGYLLEEKMVERREELIDPHLGIKDFKIDNIRLPWGRLFEIDMDIRSVV